MGNNDSPKVSSLFTPQEVVCGLKSVTREKCIRLLTNRLKQADAVSDAEPAVKAILDREALGSTIVAPGLAVPHARMESQSRTVLAVATSPEGIAFGPGPQGQVNLVVLILTGTDSPGAYLQVLAAVVRAFADASSIRKVARLSKSERVWKFFDKGGEAIPEFVTAGDMMTTDFPRLRHTDTLAMAIDCFCRHHAAQIAVVDEDGDFVGVVGEEEILKLSLPEYLLWLEDLGPILHFEPFGETLKNEHVTRLAEIMSSEFVSVDEDTPAIHVARELMRREVGQVFVVRGKRLAGIVTLSQLLRSVFRG